MGEQESLTQLVVIGSSAGGIEALSTIVATLPPDFPAPIVIAQHLHPERTSHLVEILNNRSPMPVRTLEEHQRLPLEPGVILVVPANRHVEVTEHEISLIPDGAKRPLPSIDLLFRTAADVYGDGLIAVILTGMGSDVTAGARAVKQADGTVIIQNPETARFPEMPLSLAPSTVDVIADLGEISPLLVNLANGGSVPQTSDGEKQLTTFLDHLRRQTGIDFSSYKPNTIRRRLQQRLAATGTDDLAGYIRYAQRRPREYQRLVSSFLIKVTEFFRDIDLFDHLRNQVLPELIEDARTSGELRLWSAGCATGEEAYSLAILVAELIGDEIPDLTIRIFATDLDPDAVAFARRGLYPAAALSNLSPELRERYFTQAGDGSFEVKKAIRALLVFGQHDLGQRSPFPRIDLTLCRNVLIYFTPELQRRALQLFAFSLRHRGVLVLGRAETASPLGDVFAQDHPRLKLYRRTAERVLIPPAYLRSPTASVRGDAPAPLLATPPRSPVERKRREQSRPSSFAEDADRVLMRMPIGVVVVNQRYDILSINGAARQFLAIHGPAIGDDLIHLVHQPSLTQLRSAIDTAFQGGSDTHLYVVETIDAAAGHSRSLEITCYAERLDPTKTGPPSAVVVLVSDLTRAEQARVVVAEQSGQQRQDLSQNAKQIQRLSSMNQELATANDELAVASSELRGANEELVLAHEEVQASTEEVETLNEELQATVEELNTTNDDLQARSGELLDLAHSHEEQRQVAETERGRLRAILAALSDAVLVIDTDGQPVLTNGAYDDTFGANGDWSPQDEGGHPLPAADWPQHRAARGETFRTTFTLLGSDGSRCWYEASGQPVTGDHDSGRAVLVIRDITERSLRRLQKEFLALASHELRTPLTALSGSIQLLRRRVEAAGNDERLQRFVTSALDQVRRLEAHTDELMEVSRLQSGKLRLRQQPLDLVELTQRAAETAGFLTAGQTIRVDVPSTPLLVAGDDRRLEQVLLNLLSNAVHYSPDTGAIDIRLQCRGDRVEIEVEDYGVGITAEALPNIFSRFFQAVRGDRMEQTGLGLGLFIAREIITAHDGSIDVRSTVGEGTTFLVSLPLLDEAEDHRSDSTD